MSAELEEKRERRRQRRAERVAEATPEIEEIDEEEVDSRGITEAKGRATPGRRVEQEEGNALSRGAGNLQDYFEGVQSELEKVAWPSRQDTRRLTIAVLVTLIVSAIVLGLIGSAFTEVFRVGLSPANNSLISALIILAVMYIPIVIFVVYLQVRSRRNNARR